MNIAASVGANVNSWRLKREHKMKQEVSLEPTGVKALASTEQTHRADGQQRGSQGFKTDDLV